MTARLKLSLATNMRVGTLGEASDWKDYALRNDLLTTEFLVPRIIVDEPLSDFVFLNRKPRLDMEFLNRMIKELKEWTYHIEGEGFSTRNYGSYNDNTILFHRYRRNLIISTVVKLLGQELPRCKIVDLGCNCGFFTLEMAAMGANFAYGLDFRVRNIQQASLLQHTFGVENVSFGVENVKDIARRGEQFDVVLNLGLMYHLSTPFEVMRSCFEMSRRFCVVDTITHQEPFAGYHVLAKDPQISIEGDLQFELQPTCRGIIETMRLAGFQHIYEICLDAKNIDLYSDGSRRCFVGFKEHAQPYISNLLERSSSGISVGPSAGLPA
jgi:tRNA (mo5U34)-methyltransferase